MKHPVDTSTWGEFVVGELFNCDTTKTFYPNKSELPEGNTPYITRSTYDNGISGYYDDIDNEFTIEGNCLTIGAEGGIAFWQPKPFIAGVKVYTIRHPQLNELTALFVASLLNANSANYSYTNARVLAKIKAESIKLPLKPSADPSNYTQEDIDWDYMETVMSRVTARAKDHLANLPQPSEKQKTPVDTSAWGEFIVGELFDKITRGTRLKKSDRKAGSTPLVTAGSENQGIAEYILENKELFDGNNLTIDIFGNVFARNYPFYADDNILVLQTNVHTFSQLQFMASSLAHLANEYGYTNQFRQNTLNNTTIKLPLKPSADPSNYSQEDIDWDYMEDFMKAIDEKAHERLKTLQKAIA